MCIFLRYPFDIKGYKLLDLQSHTAFISRDVVFQESIFPFHSLNLPSNNTTFVFTKPLPNTLDFPIVVSNLMFLVHLLPPLSLNQQLMILSSLRQTLHQPSYLLLILFFADLLRSKEHHSICKTFIPTSPSSLCLLSHCPSIPPPSLVILTLWKTFLLIKSFLHHLLLFPLLFPCTLILLHTNKP